MNDMEVIKQLDNTYEHSYNKIKYCIQTKEKYLTIFTGKDLITWRNYLK